MSVSVVTCLYGDGYERFVPDWLEAVAATHPDEIIVATDRLVCLPSTCQVPVKYMVGECAWQHPQAYYQQVAFEAASSEWVWKLDLDDLALPDALDGIEDVDADVWQMGYLRSDGLRYVPPQLTAAEYLALTGNPFVGSSAMRARAFRRCGGYPDIAFEDWGVWRRLARAGCSFESSGRPHFRYALGAYTRSSMELTDRPSHIEEMLRSEPA